jgi:hypothetical protein
MFASRIVLIGGTFSVLASLNAFLIAYDEGKLRRSSGSNLWLKAAYRAVITLAAFAPPHHRLVSCSSAKTLAFEGRAAKRCAVANRTV